MTLREMGLRPIPLGERVYYTHRASSIKAHVKGHTAYGADPRDLTRRDLYRYYHDKVAGPYADYPWRHPAFGWPAPRYGSNPRQFFQRWVTVWPENGVGRVVGLTYRAMGNIDRYDEGGNEWNEKERWPFYEIKESLTSATVIVPPFACVPLDPRIVTTFGDNLPLVHNDGRVNWFSSDEERQPEWGDYVEYRLATDLGVHERKVAHAA